jgi:homoserine kinase
VTPPATASAPASSANLGPGFDVLALAVELRCVVTAEQSDEWSIEHTTEHGPKGLEVDAVLVGARAAVGERNPLRLTVANAIPLGKGLGSSAAAFVAGVSAGLRATGDDPDPDQIFEIAGRLEGHRDNVAASIYGGLVLTPAEGRSIRLPIHPSFRVILAVPDATLSTRSARQVIPEMFPRDVMVRSLARVSSLTAGLLLGDPELLAAAHGDEIHELPRSSLSPEVEGLMGVARGAGASHAARSGAGPSVVALSSADRVDAVKAALEAAGATAIPVSVATTGLAWN